MECITRGTTPTIEIYTPEDYTGLNVHVAFDAGAQVVKATDELDSIETGEHGTKIVATLTQDDTLAFTAGIPCEVQVRAYSTDGTLATATTVASIPVARVLEDGKLGGTQGE